MLRLEDNELLFDEDDDGDRLMQIPSNKHAKNKSGGDQAPSASNVEEKKQSVAQ